MEAMKTAAIIQARTGSTRLPNKIFLELAEKPLIAHVVDRLKVSKLIDDTIIATTTNKNDDSIEKWAKDNMVSYFRGSEENVLKRYYDCAKKHDADIVVRITADDPFKDANLIDEAISLLINEELDFVCNNNPATFPEGLDVEVLTFKALEKSKKKADSDFEKEHVTQYIHKNINEFKVQNIANDVNLSFHRWTIDTKEDLNYTQAIYNELYNEDRIFTPQDIYKLLKNKPEISLINNTVKRSEMYK